MKHIRWISLLIMACILSACHFHLRGKMPMAPQMRKTYLEINSMYTPFSQAIQKALKAAGVHFTSSMKDADIILMVSKPNKPQNLTTVGANQQVRQYNLSYSFVFSLSTRHGKPIIGPNTITTTREQIVQPNQVLSNNNQTQQLYADMRQEAVIDLVYQLSAVNTRKAIAAAFAKQHNKIKHEVKA